MGSASSFVFLDPLLDLVLDAQGFNHLFVAVPDGDLRDPNHVSDLALGLFLPGEDSSDVEGCRRDPNRAFS